MFSRELRRESAKKLEKAGGVEAAIIDELDALRGLESQNQEGFRKLLGAVELKVERALLGHNFQFIPIDIDFLN